MSGLTKENLQVLEEKARWVWEETLRVHRKAAEVRVASSLSCVEIFTTLYYSGIIKFNKDERYWPDRDRVIVSKGHGSIALYPIFADLGFYDKAELEHVCEEGHFLGGIPDPVIPGYETINGSLGHGLGVASGMAVALKRKKQTNRVMVVSGDGELHEGANWEAIMFAAQHQLDNLTLIVDNNQISMLDYTDNIISHRSLAEKFTAFGWTVDQVDGHSITALHTALSAVNTPHMPHVIIADTVKGKNVPGLENESLSHIMSVKHDLIDQLLAEKD